MELAVPYRELTDIIKKKTGKVLSFSYAGPMTISVGYETTFNLPLIGEKSKTFSIDVTIDHITGNDVHFSLGKGVSLLAGGALHFLDNDKICEKDEEGFLLHLDRMDNLKSTLENFSIKGIIFKNDSLSLDFNLKG